MLRIRLLAISACLSLVIGANARERFELGHPASEADIARWDIDVTPDGRGLPAGSGSVSTGNRLYQQKCLHCHGTEGRGKPFDALAGGPEPGSFPFPEDPQALRTIGNYWPYATTLFDYIRRAMPYDKPGSLTDQEVYALSAYLLFLNGLVNKDAQMDAALLRSIEMPARRRFVMDNRRGGPEVK